MNSNTHFVPLPVWLIYYHKCKKLRQSNLSQTVWEKSGKGDAQSILEKRNILGVVCRQRDSDTTDMTGQMELN